jgi:hypothetical protein
MTSRRWGRSPDRGACHTRRQTARMCPDELPDDPVPPGIVLDLDEAFRVLEGMEDARVALRDGGLGLGLQDALATVIRLLHGRLGLDEGGVV